MKKRDGRSRSDSEMEALRKRALTQVLIGKSPSRIARDMGVARASLYIWLTAYRNGGWRALSLRSGRRHKLTEAQEKWIWDTVTFKNPRRFGFASSHWTFPMVQKLILRKFRVELTAMTASNILRRFDDRAALKVKKRRKAE